MPYSIITFLGLVGLLTSSYSLYAYYRATHDKDYRALCDINNRISCSKTFRGKFGHFLGLPNGFWGIILYIIIIVAAYYQASLWLFLLSGWAVIFSIRLAYILITKVKLLCIDCIIIYVVNALLLIVSSIVYLSLTTAIYILATIGLMVSIHIYYTYRKMLSDKKHKPYCDVSARVLCSASVMSPHGIFVGIHNGIWGIGFYLILPIFMYLMKIQVVFILSIIGVLIAARLAYILFWKLKKLCINCFIIYFVNILLLIISAVMYF